MDLNKHLEFFNPTDVGSVHIIGCGAIGSNVAIMLTRLGFPKIHLYDFDTVGTHNITNQQYRFKDVGLPKVDALAEQLKEINPEVIVTKHNEGWKPGTNLNNIVVLAVDNMDVRRGVVDDNKLNNNIKVMLDFRMRLTDAQHYACDWSSFDNIGNFMSTMSFSNEEADQATPVSACGTSLSVAPTVWTIVSVGVSNLMKFLKDKELNKIILIDAFTPSVTAI